MKIKKGEKRVRLPDYGQMLGVAVKVFDGGEERWHGVNMVYMDTIRRAELEHPGIEGIPMMCCISGIYAYVWPRPAADMEIKFRYFPPEVES